MIDPGAPIVLSEIAADQADYEIEAAAVIDQGGACTAEAEARSHVAVDTPTNEVFAGNIQSRAMTGPQFELSHAKSMEL